MLDVSEIEIISLAVLDDSLEGLFVELTLLHGFLLVVEVVHKSAVSISFQLAVEVVTSSVITVSHLLLALLSLAVAGGSGLAMLISLDK